MGQGTQTVPPRSIQTSGRSSGRAVSARQQGERRACGLGVGALEWHGAGVLAGGERRVAARVAGEQQVVPYSSTSGAVRDLATVEARCEVGVLKSREAVLPWVRRREHEPELAGGDDFAKRRVGPAVGDEDELAVCGGAPQEPFELSAALDCPATHSWPAHRVVAPVEQVDFDLAAEVVVAPAAHQGGDGATEGLRRYVLASRRVGSETDRAGVESVEADGSNTADPYERGAGWRALAEGQRLPGGSFDPYLASRHAALGASGSRRDGSVVNDGALPGADRCCRRMHGVVMRFTDVIVPNGSAPWRRQQR